MPYLPELPTWEKSIINTQQFLGLNRGLSIADGEMADMINMSGDNFPVLSTRQPRGIPKFDYNAVVEPVFPGQIDGMLGTDRLVVCHDGKVYLDGVEVPITLSTEAGKREKKLVSMGAYVCIWPDKKYFNVNNPDECGDMGLKWEPADGDTISAMMCRLDGTDYDMTKIVVSNLAPEDPADQDFWLDTSGEKDVLKQYNKLHATWVQVATTYIKIEAPGIGKKIKEGDVVWLDGVHEKGTEIEDDESSDGSVSADQVFYGKDVRVSSSYDYIFTTSTPEGTVYLDGWFSTPTIGTNTQNIAITGLPNNTRVVKANLKFHCNGFSTVVNQTEVDNSNYKLAKVNGTNFDPSEGEKTIPITVKGNGNVSVKFAFQCTPYELWNFGGTSTLSISDVRIEMLVDAVNSDAANYQELKRLNTTNHIYGAGDDYIIVAGLLHNVVTLDSTFRLEMKVPDFDFVCESNNRIWGCIYAAEDGTVLNEVHACALGDYRNWYKYSGTAADSYTMTIGSDGVFTGAYSLQGVPLFFKESFIHRISGTVPANYTLNTIRGRGVQEGSWKSLTTVNETLFYKSRSDIMAYEGAMPYSVGAKLGQDNYKNAVGGGYRDKYYLCMQDDSLMWHTYVLDTSKGLWHQEDMQKIPYMATIGGELVLGIEGTENTELRTVGNNDGTKESFPWSVTFGVMGYQSEQQKYLSRYNIRAQMSAGSHMKVEMQYDSNGKWVHMGTMKSPRLQTFLLPIIPRRCDHCQLRISGTGKINIYSVAREYETGGDG